jgi:uncharacterized protein with beta-barrel porin domain
VCMQARRLGRCLVLGNFRRAARRALLAVGRSLGHINIRQGRFAAATLAAWLVILPKANAACLVAFSGTINCAGVTATTDTTNLDGANTVSTDRQQLFDSGVAINATVQPGAIIGGFGLRFSQDFAAAAAAVTNQGSVNSSGPVNTLQIDGNGGPISYSGNGSLMNTTGGGAGLFVNDVRGDISVATGSGPISGATGIETNTTGRGTTTIVTGPGSVTGTTGSGIRARTVDGALDVTVASGVVANTQVGAPAIDLTSRNGDISVIANGNVSALGAPLPNTRHYAARVFGIATDFGVHGIEATSTGRGNITIGGSGTIFGEYGRGIYALEGLTGLGGILITGTGNTVSGTATLGCCSALRAQIENPADSSDIVVDRSGNFITTSTLVVANAALHAITAGTGNIIVQGGPDAVISNTGFFGIDAAAYGSGSTGSINVSTGAAGIVQSGGTGILASNYAFAIPSSAKSTITVTANGTINSGPSLNPVGYFLFGGSGAGIVPAGILAGYDGGPVLGRARGPYTSCGLFGCTTLTPNPNVNGTVDVINNAVIHATGGDGIHAFNFGNGDVSVTSTAPITVTGATAQNGIEAFSAEVGNIAVTTMASVVTAKGSGIATNSAGVGTTTINVLAGTAEGAISGVTAASKSGAIAINNWGTIRNFSGSPGSLAIATAGPGNATVNNNASGVVTGTIAMTGSGSDTLVNAGAWNTLGTSRFADSSINNSGTINLFGPTTFSGLTSFINSGTLTVGAGTTVATLTVPGELAFQSGALYVVALEPPAASVIQVGGTAALAGAVEAAFLAGAYAKGESFTILHARGGLTGSFSGFSSPGFAGTLAYTPTDVMLTLTGAKLGAGIALNTNQRNVAAAINNYFNAGGTLPGGFVPPLFNQTGGALANGLSQLSGEVAADAERGAFEMMTEFLNVMLDPFVYGRFGGTADVAGGPAIGFAPDTPTILPPDVALAYASILKAQPPAPFQQRWTAWGSAYGGANSINRDTAAGSSNLAAQTFGIAAGMDYHYSPDTIFGFALGGGGIDWSLATGGTGRSDTFQAGVYGISRSGPAYLAAALAFNNNWMTTNRGALGDVLTANFTAQGYGARFEGGYRYAPLPLLGVTPYAAVQAQDFHAPSYNESDSTGAGFGLSYAAMNAVDVRTELGARFDDLMVIGGTPVIPFGRLAWAHDFVSNPSLSAAFESLPGSNFIVNGAPVPQNSALTSAGAQFRLTAQLSLLVKFDGEFAAGSQTYGGSGTLRYRW